MSDKNLQDIKDTITEAGNALLEYSKTGAAFLPLDGDKYVAIGTLAGIASVAGKGVGEGAPAAAGIEGLTRYGVGSNGEPYAIITGKYYLVADVERLLGERAPVAAKLTDERIGELWVQAIEQFQRHEHGVSVHPSIHLARAIESEVLAHAGVGAAIDTDNPLPPQDFVDYVTKNYAGDVFIADPAWHAMRLWNVAMRSAKVAAPAAQAPVQNAEEVRKAAMLDQALRFADDVISNAFDGGDLDGGTVQEMAEARGLIVPRTMTEPCGPVCNCMEADADFPTTCYRKTYSLATKEAAAATEGDGQ